VTDLDNNAYVTHRLNIMIYIKTFFSQPYLKFPKKYTFTGTEFTGFPSFDQFNG